MSYPIMYQSERPAGVLVPASPGGATGQVIPAGVASTEGDAGMSAIGLNFAPPPLTRYQASGAQVGSTAEAP